MSDKRIEITRENLQIMREWAEAATDPTAYGPCPLEEGQTIEQAIAARLEVTGPSRTVWTVYEKRGDGDWFTAITGNGANGEANARFYGSARAMVLSLLEELLERRSPGRLRHG